MELIVVGVDDSATARAAAEVAAGLARLAGAKLHLVTAQPHLGANTVAGPGGEAFFVDEAASSRDYLSTLGTHWPDLEVTVAVGEGHPGAALVAEAERLGADLIVVGNKRVQSLARVLGTVATDVLHHAPCDVYVVNTSDVAE